MIRSSTLPITVMEPMIPGPAPEVGIACPVVALLLFTAMSAVVGAGVFVALVFVHEHVDSAGQLAFRHRFIPSTDAQESPDAQSLSVLQDASHRLEFGAAVGVTVVFAVDSICVGPISYVGVAVGSSVVKPTPPPDAHPVPPHDPSKHNCPQS